MKELDGIVLMNFINQLVDEFYDDYILSDERKEIFINQVYNTSLGTCETLTEVSHLVDGILIGWFMER
jgi:hypothetical protein